MIPVTLVAGGDGKQREQAIATARNPGIPTAVILEGLPGPGSHLENETHLEITRIAAGCPCCEGNLVMRVTLNRLVRRKPAHLYIGLATSDHLPALRALLCAPPYAGLLELTKDLLLGSRSQ